jgi:hypothetical protein
MTIEKPTLFQTPTTMIHGSAQLVLWRKLPAGKPIEVSAWGMIPIVGSRRNFQTMPIVAKAEMTGKK